MRSCLKTSFLLLFPALLLAVSNPLAAQERDDPQKLAERRPLRVRFQLGMGTGWYSLATKDDYQIQTWLPEAVFRVFQSGEQWPPPVSHVPHLNESQVSGFRVVDVKTGYRFSSDVSLGLIFEKQIDSKMGLQVAPTLVLGEKSVVYETELIGVDGTVIDSLQVFSRDVAATYVKLPIMVKYRPFVKPLFFVGGISPMVKLERKPEYHSADYLQPNRFDMSAVFGIGYQFYKRLGVQVTVSLGLVNVIKGREEYRAFYYLPLKSARTNQLRIDFVF